MTQQMGRFILALIVASSVTSCSAQANTAPPCSRPANQWILVAQAVPSATYLPCVRTLPIGWSLSSVTYERGSYTAWLDSDRAGPRALEVSLTSTCNLSHAVAAPTATVSGTTMYDDLIRIRPEFEENQYVVFPGGCITYAFRFMQHASHRLASQVEQSLGVVPRNRVRRAVAQLGLTLCGAGAAPCPG
jgi:hypothetical protein